MGFSSQTQVLFLFCGTQPDSNCEILSKMGYQGPKWCCLCLFSGEDINHFFLHCTFACSLWTCVLQLIYYPANWNHSHIVSYLGRWTMDHQIHRTLVFFIISGIWQSRNALIFEQVMPRSRNSLIFEQVMPDI